jgi:hypothetical protein
MDQPEQWQAGLTRLVRLVRHDPPALQVEGNVVHRFWALAFVSPAWNIISATTRPVTPTWHNVMRGRLAQLVELTVEPDLAAFDGVSEEKEIWG